MANVASKTRVPFTLANVTRCMCPKCPVQAKSKCVSEKAGKLGAALKEKPLKSESIPGLYCASGAAACKDIDTKQGCICGSCLVFTDYKLSEGKPVGKYCRDGKAV